jgi:hydroxymethylbilane synthase
MRTIKVGTRQSALALTQTGQVIDRLRGICQKEGLDCQFEVVKIVTKGDQILDVTLSKVGGKGLFVKEIEQALLDGTVDMAVHSMKDVPSERQDGLVIGAVPERVDPRDCLITKGATKLEELPQGARVGTSSLRRASQLLAIRPDLRVEPVRGNIDSRLRKLDTEGFDAIVLASAGLYRMGWSDRITAYLPPDQCIPAVGQGALGIECREGDDFMMELLSKLHHEPTALAVTAERAFLARLNGGCQVPIGAHAVVLGPDRIGTEANESPALQVTGMVGAPDGGQIIREAMIGHDAGALGEALAEALIARGADRILADARG